MEYDQLCKPHKPVPSQATFGHDVYTAQKAYWDNTAVVVSTRDVGL